MNHYYDYYKNNVDDDYDYYYFNCVKRPKLY